MVEFIIGQAGSGKTSQAFARMKAAAEKGGEICAVVPEQHSYEFDKALYEYLGAELFNDIESLSFTGLARQLFQTYGEPDRKGEYADELARTILVYRAIDSVRKRPEGFRFFGRRSSAPGFAEEASSLISDMKRSGVTPDDLRAKAGLMDDRLRDKTSDIAEVYAEYERLMSAYGFKDVLDNVREAAKIANLNGYFRGKTVYIDEFESFTGDQLEMLSVMISSAEGVVITLRTDDVNAGEFTLFETVNATYRQIATLCRENGAEYKTTSLGASYRFKSPDLEYISANVMRSGKLPGDVPEPTNATVFEAKDAYSETEYVCATIKRLIRADETLKYRDIAVISNNIAGYAAVLKAAFERYDIPYFLSVERPVNHTAIMSFFTSLLDLLTARKLRSEHIFRVLKSGLLSYSLADVSLLENYCYKWEIDGETWLSPFEADDPALKRIEGVRESFISGVAKLKKSLSRKITAAKSCELIYDYLVKCGAERNVGRLMGDLVKRNRDFEASELKRLWGCLIDILDSLSSTLGEEEPTIGELSAIARSMIGAITYSTPPRTLDSVVAASARTARLNSPRVVFVMGANDGDFPNQVDVHGLFSENDKQRLEKSGLKISRPLSDLIAAERLVVYKSLSAASERLYLTYPLTDLSGQAKYPAPPVDRIAGAFGERIRVSEDDLRPDYYAVTMRSAFYRYMLERKNASPSVAAIEKALTDDPEFSRRVAYALSRSNYSQDFRVDPGIMEKLKSFEPLRLSPSDVEDYDLCRFKYFCGRCLRLQSCERVELDARISGELIHECFKTILSSRTKAEFISMSFDSIRGAISDCAEKYRREKLAGEFAKNRRFELTFSKLTERLGSVLMYAQQSLMRADFTPDRFEFDLRAESPVTMSFGDGKTLSFGGIIDRADICDIGGRNYLRIIDYKSRRKVITPETLAGGVNLQMLLYLFAATEKGGVYEGYLPAGALYSPIRIGEVKTDAHRVESVNSGAIEAGLRTSGLVLEDMDVLEAMEKGLEGRFIPVKKTAAGDIDKRSSGLVSAGKMDKLKDYVYSALKETAESMLAGNVEAEPLIVGGENPCEFCDYVNICDNSQGERYRRPDEAKLAEAAELLGRKDGKEGEA